MEQPKIDIKLNDTYEFNFTGNEIMVIYTKLLTEPYNQVAPLIAKIEQLVLEQVKK